VLRLLGSAGALSTCPYTIVYTLAHQGRLSGCQKALTVFFGLDRFNYSAEFLKWALLPPGFCPDWHLGVRVAHNRKLVGFITGVPAEVSVRGKLVRMVEINYLCVHKKLRSKRLAPVLIKVRLSSAVRDFGGYM
jgi:hypothetical protein